MSPAGEHTYKFWCPGCDSAHAVRDAWTVNTGTATISPSVLVYSNKTFIDSTLEGDALTAPENISETPQCHSFVTDGCIQFLGDCTHSLAGRTVELPDWEEAA